MSVDDQTFADFLVVGGFHVEALFERDGLCDFDVWSKQMLDDLGNLVQEHLHEIWDCLVGFRGDLAMGKDVQDVLFDGYIRALIYEHRHGAKFAP